MRVESSCCCFPRELVSFVCTGELVCFDSRHMLHFPSIENVFELGGITNIYKLFLLHITVCTRMKDVVCLSCRSVITLSVGLILLTSSVV